MSTKKTSQQITDYYRKKDVVETYDDRRFPGKGGNYINQNEIKSIINHLVILDKNKTVLDIGAGRGRLSLPILDLKFDTYCLDRSEEMITYLSKKFTKKRLIHQSIFDPIQTKVKFDVITGLRFFDHFNIDDQYKILLNLQKVLNKDGKIVLSVLNRNSLEAIFSKFFPYGRYNYYYSDDEYKDLAKKLNMTVEKKSGYFFIPRGFFLRFANQVLLVSLLAKVDKYLSQLLPNLSGLFTYTLTKHVTKSK